MRSMSFQTYIVQSQVPTALQEELAALTIRSRHFNRAEALWDHLQRSPPPEIIVAHVVLPDHTGMWLCQKIKDNEKLKRIPFIMIASGQDEMERIMGMEYGADDHVSSDVSPVELALRIQRMLMRTQLSVKPANWLETPPFRIYPLSQKVYCNGIEIELTTKEYALLTSLCSAKGKSVSRRRLYTTIWGEESDFQSRVLDTYVKRLRKKLGDFADTVQTVHGDGYKLAPKAVSKEPMR